MSDPVIDAAVQHIATEAKYLNEGQSDTVHIVQRIKSLCDKIYHDENVAYYSGSPLHEIEKLCDALLKQLA